MISDKEKQEVVACSKCDSCKGYLDQLGLDITKFDFVIGLAGNPNTGKSTVFNALTGLRQHTGNWPGKTVTRAEGGFRYEGNAYKLVDLPGTYSLLSTSTDEEIARNFILFGQPDCTLIVVDATCLERNLNLVLQVLEITDRVIVALNLMDEVKRKGIEIDHRALSRDLGVSVVPISARLKEGFPELLKTIKDTVEGKIKNKPHRIKIEGTLKNLIDKLVPKIKKSYPRLPNPDWIAMRLLEGDTRIREAFINGELENIGVR